MNGGERRAALHYRLLGYRVTTAKRGPVPLTEETATERKNVLLSDWFVTFKEEVERCHREVLLLRRENLLLRVEVERLRAWRA